MTRLDDMTAERDRLKASFASESNGPQSISFLPSAEGLYANRIEQLRQSLTGETVERRQAETALRALIDCIELSPRTGLGTGWNSPGVEINVTGYLAGILQIASGTKPEHNPNVVGVQVVAGLGFEPRTFRL